MKKIQPGDRVKDKLSEFQGVVTARAEYLHRSPMVKVQGEHLHNGKPVDGEWLEESQCEVTNEAEFKTGFQPPRK